MSDCSSVGSSSPTQSKVFATNSEAQLDAGPFDVTTCPKCTSQIALALYRHGYSTTAADNWRQAEVAVLASLKSLQAHCRRPTAVMPDDRLSLRDVPDNFIRPIAHKLWTLEYSSDAVVNWNEARILVQQHLSELIENITLRGAAALPDCSTACGKQKWDETRQDEDFKGEIDNKTNTSNRRIMQLLLSPNVQG